jgi:SAM-dependent methyltransferase
MVGRRGYDLMYRWWAPWDAVGVREDLRRLVEDHVVAPNSHPEVVDLGCGTGANVAYLAARGFRVTGLDFSVVALAKARVRVAEAGVTDRVSLLEADLTDEPLPLAGGTFDLLLDFGSIDDLTPVDRPAAARNAARLARPGAVMLFWCFYARRVDLPAISFHGPSRVTPGIEPGEETELFGDAFDIVPYARHEHLRAACFLLTRRDVPAPDPPVRPDGYVSPD